MESGRLLKPIRHQETLENHRIKNIMVNRKTAQKIRKTHRYLGLFLGI